MQFLRVRVILSCFLVYFWLFGAVFDGFCMVSQFAGVVVDVRVNGSQLIELITTEVSLSRRSFLNSTPFTYALYPISLITNFLFQFVIAAVRLSPSD